MSEALDTPNMARLYCPSCEPEADPAREILDVRWCPLHNTPPVGAEDEAVRSYAYLSGSGEAGGEDNRRWCDAIHRAARTAVVAVLCWTAAASMLSVTDGDTFVADVSVWIGWTARERVRVLGVDAPERKGETREAGDKAKAFATAWLDDEELSIWTCGRDSFGRILATVTRTRDGASLAADLIASGHGTRR